MIRIDTGANKTLEVSVMAETQEHFGGCASCRELERQLELLRRQAYNAISELDRELREAQQDLRGPRLPALKQS
jgi:hypothetical protein